MRVLALDHGTVRIGCAISDPSGTLVRPLPTIEPPEPRSVAELVAEHGVEVVVVGLPLHLSGEEGAQAAIARTFCAELKAILEGVAVETYDERLTTRMAEASRRGGATASADSLAAAHLLEGYLAANAGKGDDDDG
ncbi:MAG TPA: Holliday junction resolvase RuvX [Solirubrobacterales bacterium]